MAGRISGSPFYEVRPNPTGSPADESISATLAVFDPTQVHARWTMALERRGSEPAGAIALARTLLKDVCKWILEQAGATWQEADDLPVLYRKLAKVLKVAPDDHTEQVFKQILGSCQSIVESLGALHNKLSDAHGTGPKKGSSASASRGTTVYLAGAMATFLVATWEARQTQNCAADVTGAKRYQREKA
jgi:abortive infection Abi-like protein